MDPHQLLPSLFPIVHLCDIYWGKVQLIPTAAASSAAIAADFLIASISQLADSANGIGLIVL
jgi:hypothetical protein